MEEIYDSFKFQIFKEEKYNDIILNIDSITKLFKEGWDVINSEEGNKNLTVVGVIGTKNKGKTYILQKISGNNLPHGKPTKGIRFLYPKNLNYNIILMDSVGFEVPSFPIQNEFDINDEKKNTIEEEIKKLNEEIEISINDKEKFEILNNKKNELLSKKNLLSKKK